LRPLAKESQALPTLCVVLFVYYIKERLEEGIAGRKQSNDGCKRKEQEMLQEKEQESCRVVSTILTIERSLSAGVCLSIWTMKWVWKMEEFLQKIDIEWV